ncbi:hypothetical protein ACFWBX_25800 [Streptomyces sp. NPDC059991]|uniref:hypothetical protein n=1 Tax=Streptomyces sp. NPDC059991 TaxID=3347028 RepID=UPI00367DE259
MYEYDLIVVGAGPYGRSIAAHATAAGLHLRLLGRRTQRAALPVDERKVTAVRPYGRDGFEVVTADGESMRTRTVALALGPNPLTEPALPAREFRPHSPCGEADRAGPAPARHKRFYAAHPALFRRLPTFVRVLLTDRPTGPMSGGTTRYRASTDRVTVLSMPVRRRLSRTPDAPPWVDTRFESAHPGLFFAGLLTAAFFGPAIRSAHGAEFTARRVLKGVRRRLGTRPR